MQRIPSLTKSLAVLMILLALSFPSVAPAQASSGAYTFASFDSGTITGGAAPVFSVMDTTNVPAGYYFSFVVTGEFTGTGGDDSAWSDSISLEITNGDSVTYFQPEYAHYGAEASGDPTTLYWSGMLTSPYTAGTALVIGFSDDYDDESGTYYSEMQNVSVTLYSTLSPEHTFDTIDSGMITSGAEPVYADLNTASVPAGEYVTFVASGDFIPTGGDDSAISETINMEITSGDVETYVDPARARSGGQPNPDPTTLIWSGILIRPYAAGDSLAIGFSDDAAGAYYSELHNVSVTLHHLISADYTFASFNSGTITGGAAPVYTVLDAGNVPAGEYIAFTVTGEFVGTGGDDSAWSESINMEITNGGTVLYFTPVRADIGGQESSEPTTLFWSGTLTGPYTAGDTLSIGFSDDLQDAVGTKYSEIQNFTLTIYAGVTDSPNAVKLESSRANSPWLPFVLAAMSMLGLVVVRKR